MPHYSVSRTSIDCHERLAEPHFSFMNRDWQFSKTGATIPNPTSAALGPQLYDSHLYFNFGGVSPDQTPDSYMKTICSLNQLESLSRIGDTPLVYGELPRSPPA